MLYILVNVYICPLAGSSYGQIICQIGLLGEAVPDERCRISRSGSAKKAALALSAPLIAGDRYIN
jgi:hypothetical protein